MRSLAPLLLLLAGLVPLRAQWQIFAEKLPAPGTWASFRMETLREGKVVSTGDLRFSVRPGREVEGKPHVWLTVEPVMRLGSRVGSTRMEFRGPDGKLMSTGAGAYIVS